MNTLIADGYKWRQVEAARCWRPVNPGDVLVGRFAGRQERDGQWGQYHVVLVRTPEGTFYVSGAVANSLIMAEHLESGRLVRIEYLGKRDGAMDPDTGEVRAYRNFALYVADAKAAETSNDERGTAMSDILDRAALRAWGAKQISDYTVAMHKTIETTLQCLDGKSSRDAVAFAADACGEYERLTLMKFLTEQGIG